METYTVRLTDRKNEADRIERVTVEGVELLVTVSTIRCNDGIMRDMADPFVQVEEAGNTVSLALSSKRVSDKGVQDAIAVALMTSRDSDA